MNPFRSIMVIALSVLFLIPPVQAADDGVRAGMAAPRSDWKQPSAVEVELKGAGNLFNSSSLVIPVPANSTITSASVDLLGKLVKGNQTTVTCDFSQQDAGHRGFKGMVTDFDRASTSLTKLSTGAFSSADYDAVATSDDTRASQPGDYSGNNDGYELFRFHVPVDESAQVDVLWEGYAGTYYSGGSEYSTWIWNAASTIWENMETASPATDKEVRKTYTGDWYIDNRTVNILAMCTDGDDIMTDYVKVTVQGSPYYFPSNLTMDVGANGKTEWTSEENKFNYSLTVEEPAIAIEMQELAFNSPTQYANLTIRFTSTTSGKLKISNFKFTYIAPAWCRGIPDTYHLAEDSQAVQLIDLRPYFIDDGPTLTYLVSFQQDKNKVTATLDADGHSLTFRTIAKNWWGKVRFGVSATDSDGLVTESNNFTVTVDPVNDAPTIQSPGDQKARQGEYFSLQVKAADVDTTLDRNETLNFSDDAPMFDIEPASGWINFTPKQSDVGVFSIIITVTDKAGATASTSFMFTVEDVEDPPVMRSIPDMSATDGEPFMYTVNVTDPDLPYGDSLTFSDDTTLFEINPLTGTVAFTPKTKDIGIYKITITVKDARSKSDRKTMNLTVKNYLGTVDKPPSLEAITEQTAVEGELFSFTVNASDPDLDGGDSLSFTDNSPLFVIGPANGTIEFVPNGLNVGVYKITVTVADQDDLTCSTSFRLTILKKNAPPVLTKVRPKPGTKALVNKDVYLSAEATDPDNDRLTYTWKEGDVVLGTGSGILATFNATGRHTITLVVTDGRAQATNNTYVDVVTSLPAGKGTPGFGAALAFAAVFMAVAGLASRRKR